MTIYSHQRTYQKRSTEQWRRGKHDLGSLVLPAQINLLIEKRHRFHLLELHTSRASKVHVFVTTASNLGEDLGEDLHGHAATCNQSNLPTQVGKISRAYG